MSGIEVAGLALGVLPILLEVVKSYSTIRDKVRMFRRCTQEVDDLFVKFKATRLIFVNEVRWILRSIESKQQARLDLERGDDQPWASQEIDDQLSAVLRDNYEVCGEIMQQTRRVLDEIKAELERFDCLLSHKSPTESLKSAYKRLRKALKITFNSSKYEKCLASLSDRNVELGALRSQVVAMEQQGAPTAAVCIRRMPLPAHFKTIQDISRQLHESLCRAWRCDHPAHCGHDAKLCLDADVVNEVTLDLAISCREPAHANSASPPQESTIWLFVRSTSTSTVTQSTPPKSQDKLDLCSALAIELLSSDTICPPKSVKKKASSDLSEQPACKKKARRVHFEASPSATVSKIPSTDISGTLLKFGIDLCKTKSICDHLRECHNAQLRAPAQQCIGYLESLPMYKHLFYFSDATAKPGLNSTATSSISSVREALRQDVYDALQPEDRLRLAHRLAVAALQYNDTPWLPDRWRLADVSYLGSKTSFNVDALKTLHFNSQISQPTNAVTADGRMEDLQQSNTTISEETRYGINNTMLFFLGVAMLEIAYWKPIEEKMTGMDENNPVYAARRLALDRGAPLGPEYQRIAQKCLQCNFGFGNKLSNKGLQSAVYNDVVCQLDEMITRLEKLSV